MQIAIPVLQVLSTLTNAGFEAFVVGGCVRDSLMGRTPHDWDVTTNASPDDMIRIFQHFSVIPTGLAHGTVTVIADGLPVEVTTYRVDGDYTDHRHPNEVHFTTSLQEDLARRDFTVNAMAYHPQAGIVDPFGGQQDLTAKVIRCVGDPDKRLQEDALRIMRALQFASVLDFAIDQQTSDAARRLSPTLCHVSVERLYHELVLLLCGGQVQSILLDYPDVLAVILPEISAMVGYPQHHPCHHLDVYEHTAASVAAIAPDPILRLTMLFHDAGKPLCRTTDDTGCDHFYGHAKKSAALAAVRLTALKAERATIDTVVQLIEWHDMVLPITRPVVRRWIGRMGEEGFRRWLAVKHADSEAQAAAIRPKRQQEWQRMVDLANEIIAEQLCCSRRQLAINGRDLMDMGIAPGEALGHILDQLLEAVIDERLPNEKEALLAEARDLAEQA